MSLILHTENQVAHLERISPNWPVPNIFVILFWACDFFVKYLFYILQIKIDFCDIFFISSTLV